MKPEAAIQCAIVETLSFLCRTHGFMFFAPANEGFMLAATAKGGGMTRRDSALLTILRKMGFTPGVCDLMLMHRGNGYALEVKTPEGEQSTNQYLFEEWCRRCGVPYRVVRSVEETLTALKEWGVIG